MDVAQATLPEATPEGHLRFPTFQALHAAAPQFNSGKLVVHGTLPTLGPQVFHVVVEQAGWAQPFQGEVVASRDGLTGVRVLQLSPALWEALQAPPAPPEPDDAWVPEQLEEPGFIALLFRAAERGVSGHLVVQQGTRAKGVSLARGFIVQVRTNDPAEREQEALALQYLDTAGPDAPRDGLERLALQWLGELCTWRDGVVAFRPDEVDPHAGPLRHPVLPVCRAVTTKACGFQPDRALRWLGADSALGVGRSAVPPEHLSPVEQRVLAEVAAAPGVAVADLVERLHALGAPNAEVLQALLVLVHVHHLAVTRAAPPDERLEEESVFGHADSAIRPAQDRPAQAEALRPRQQATLRAVMDKLGKRALTSSFRHGTVLTAASLARRLAELRSDALAQLSQEPDGSPVRQAVLARLDELEAVTKDPVEGGILLRAHSLGQDPLDPATHDKLEADLLRTLVEEALAAGRFAQVLPLVRREGVLRPGAPEVEIHQALAKVAEHPTEAARQKAAVQLMEEAGRRGKEMEWQIAAVRGSLLAAQWRMARRALEAARRLDPKDLRLNALSREIDLHQADHIAQAAAAGRHETASSVGTALKLGGLVAGLLLTLGALAVGMDLGTQEHTYTGDDGFWFFRRGLLLAAAFVGAKLVFNESPRQFFKALPRGLSKGSLIIAAVIGVASGALSTSRRFDPGTTEAAIALLVITHVVTEELFFTGVVNRALGQLLQVRVAGMIGVAAYSLYHLTFHSFSGGTPLEMLPTVVARVAMGAAIPYVMLYLTSGSVLPPLLCHLLVNLTAMTMSMVDPPPLPSPPPATAPAVTPVPAPPAPPPE